MSHFFGKCQNLELLNLKSFNTEKVKYINNMFENCYKLLKINLFNFNISYF